MRLRYLLLGLVTFCAASLLSFAGPSLAAEMSEAECTRLHPEIRSPVEMVECTSDIEGSRKQLDDAYGALVKAVSKEARPPLQKSQKAWLAFRTAQCAYQARGTGNTMDSSDKIACTAQMNRARASVLESDTQRWK